MARRKKKNVVSTVLSIMLAFGVVAGGVALVSRFVDKDKPCEHETQETLSAVSPTCTENGKTAGKVCVDCGEILLEQKTILAFGHTERQLPAVDSTCAETGLTAGSVCDTCGETLTYQSVVNKKAHTDVAYASLSPTYTEDGKLKGKICSECGETIEGVFVFAKNRTSTLNISLKDLPFSKILTVYVGNTLIEDFFFENNMLTFSPVKVPSQGITDVYITALDETTDCTVGLTTQIDIVDYAIGTIEEFNDFGSACQMGKTNLRAVLTSDIDYENGYFTAYFSAGLFDGYLDGQGHTIKNVRVRHSVFMNVRGTTEKPAVIKNIGFEIVNKVMANGGGILANELWNAEVSNVYVSGKVTGHELLAGSLYGYGENLKISNCVFYADYESNPSTTPVLTANLQKNVQFENVYIISPNSNGELYANHVSFTGTPIMTNVKLYTSVDDFKAEITAVPESFDGEYWEMQDDLLTFKSVN